MRLKWLGLLVLFVLILQPGCQDQVKNSDSKIELNPAVQYWQEYNKGHELIKMAEGDLNADGREDTVVIYKIGKEKCRMQAILNLPSGYRMTGKVPAPVSNQTLEFKNIDDKPPTEILVSGVKGSYPGYAIFRLEKGELVNLFGENMDKCC
ncbi:MAG: Cys-Cys-COOH (seleno)protein SaoC [Chitinophagales bacterium]